jgi:molybdopterin synthase sulfur carrier subunit
MTVKYFATYREFTRKKEEDIPLPHDIWALLQSLGERYRGFGAKLFSADGTEVGEDTIILVNGRNIAHLEGKNTLLAESDVVSIFPVVAGG